MSDLTSRYNEIEKLIDAEKFEEAIEGLEAILVEDESFVLAHLALARAATKLEKSDLAIKHAERACELEPTDSFNFTALSVTYQRAWAATQKQEYITKAEDAMARGQMLARS